MPKTRRRAYPSVNSQTKLREGKGYGKRGNARHQYNKQEKGK